MNQYELIERATRIAEKLAAHSAAASYLKTKLAQLASLREHFGLTQTELAKEANVDVSYISKVERGHLSRPGKQALCRIAEAYKTLECTKTLNSV